MNIDELERKELRNYLDFLFWHYRVVDSFWYISVEEDYGTDVANKINERVWRRAAGLAAKDILKRYEIVEKGLDGFVKAQNYFPWKIIVDYEITRDDDAVIISVPHCVTQESRLKRNLPEYQCKEMHLAEFEAFAHIIDPNIKVECVHAPLDPHPPERFCQWKFTV